MNAITPRLAPATAPVMSRRLDAAIADSLNPHPDIGPAAADADVLQEARSLLPAVEAYLRPATAAEWRQFLRPLAAAVARPPESAEFDMRVSAIAFGLGDMPAVILSEARQREALRRFRFWPTPAEVAEWLLPEATRMRTRLRALREFADRKPPAPPAPPRPEDTAAEARDRLARLEAGPRDRFAAIAARVLRSQLERDAPDLAREFGPRLDVLLGARASAKGGASGVASSHLAGDALAAARQAIGGRA